MQRTDRLTCLPPKCQPLYPLPPLQQHQQDLTLLHRTISCRLLFCITSFQDVPSAAAMLPSPISHASQPSLRCRMTLLKRMQSCIESSRLQLWPFCP